jgi:hypothetical protein
LLLGFGRSPAAHRAAGALVLASSVAFGPDADSNLHSLIHISNAGNAHLQPESV